MSPRSSMRLNYDITTDDVIRIEFITIVPLTCADYLHEQIWVPCVSSITQVVVMKWFRFTVKMRNAWYSNGQTICEPTQQKSILLSPISWNFAGMLIMRARLNKNTSQKMVEINGKYFIRKPIFNKHYNMISSNSTKMDVWCAPRSIFTWLKFTQNFTF